MINVGNISADQGAKLRENLKSMWNAYFAPADNDKDGKITCAELISYFKQVPKYTTNFPNSDFDFLTIMSLLKDNRRRVEESDTSRNSPTHFRRHRLGQEWLYLADRVLKLLQEFEH